MKRRRARINSHVSQQTLQLKPVLTRSSKKRREIVKDRQVHNAAGNKSPSRMTLRVTTQLVQSSPAVIEYAAHCFGQARWSQLTTFLSRAPAPACCTREKGAIWTEHINGLARQDVRRANSNTAQQLHHAPNRSDVLLKIAGVCSTAPSQANTAPRTRVGGADRRQMRRTRFAAAPFDFNFYLFKNVQIRITL